jgi:mono/diheme cytochrome c family protein
LEGDVLKRGERVFLDFCFPCHGQQGGGDGPVVARGFPAPPVLTAEPAENLTDGEVFHILTFGRANMPPYRDQLSRDQRWTVIRYLRHLQQEKDP